MTSPLDVADHQWFVEEREYARHVARRGRRHAFGHLDPRRTALVVVDLVPFFVRESAYVRGILVADACAAMRDQDHNSTLHVVHRSYGDVRSTDEVQGLIAAGTR